MQHAKLGKYTVYFENGEEYHKIKREVWGMNCYYIEKLVNQKREQPITIVDAGAHIGVATLYFRHILPQAKILAIEPFPKNAKLWCKNMEENQIENVELWEGALAEHEGKARFYFDKSDKKWFSTAGFAARAWNETQESEEMRVRTTTLLRILEQYRPNLVKMDIEGAEERVIEQAKEKLSLCRDYLIEYHPGQGRELGGIVRTFEEQGFEVGVWKGTKQVVWWKAKGLSLIEAVGK